MQRGKLIALLAALPADAYIGPGASAGTVAVVIGILASTVMAFSRSSGARQSAS